MPRLRRATPVKYDFLCYHALVNLLCQFISGLFLCNARVKSMGRGVRFIEVVAGRRRYAVVPRNALNVVSRIDGARLQGLREAGYRVVVISSTPLDHKFFTRYQHVLSGVEVAFTLVAYKPWGPRWVDERLRLALERSWLRGNRVAAARTPHAYMRLAARRVVRALRKVGLKLKSQLLPRWLCRGVRPRGREAAPRLPLWWPSLPTGPP